MRVLVFSAVVALLFVGCAPKKYEVRYDPSKDSTPQSATKTADPKMKPYTVNGKTYFPSFVSIGEEFSGIASWYGKEPLDKYTANGEVYDMYADTGAHKTLPMNTIVRVTNINNNKSVVARINDRGPFVEGRIIDLSYAAAKSIELDKTGTAPVKLTVLGFDGKISTEQKSVTENRPISSIALQIGAFRNKSGADDWAAKHSNVNGVYKSVVKSYEFQGSPMYRVMLTGFRGDGEVRDFMKEGKFPGSFVISLD